MTGEPPAANGPQRWRWLETVIEHPVLLAVALLITILAGVAGFVNDSGLRDLFERESTGTDRTAVDSTHSTPSGTDPSASASESIAIGSCLDGHDAATACDAPHVSEVFNASGDCSDDALLQYLGGLPGQDILRVDLRLRPISTTGSLLCVVDKPSQALVSNSRDALLNRSGDPWRRCHDAIAREVSCAQPHTTEVVYEEQSAGEDLDCRTRADAYLEIPFARHAAELELLQDAKHCYVGVRGDDLLNGSLRRLGTKALPLEPSISD